MTNAQNPANTTAAVRVVECGVACETIPSIMRCRVLFPSRPSRDREGAVPSPIVSRNHLWRTRGARHHSGLQNHLYVLLVPLRRRISERFVHVPLIRQEFARRNRSVERHPGNRNHRLPSASKMRLTIAYSSAGWHSAAPRRSPCQGSAGPVLVAKLCAAVDVITQIAGQAIVHIVELPDQNGGPAAQVRRRAAVADHLEWLAVPSGTPPGGPTPEC